MEDSSAQIQAFLFNGGVISWIATALLALLVSFLIKMILKMITTRLRPMAQATTSIWDDVGLDIIDGLKTVVLFCWLFFLFSHSLAHEESLKKILYFAVVCASVAQVLIWGLYLIKNWRKSALDRRIQEDPSSAAALELLYTAAQASLVVVLFLIALSNLGVDITALVAGLGVGGIAVALAAQNLLGDLFASLSIVLDKPFVIGDFIVAGQEKGTVEHIGIKTTRLRSLSGEQVVISNKDLLESRIQNFKRMYVRRVVQNFGIVYSTPVSKMQQIPSWVKDIVLSQNLLSFDRCHFMAYGKSSLDFELVFFVNDPDYNKFMDLQQIVLIDIFKKFQSEGVGFAFPTQTIHVESLPPPQTSSTH